MIFVAYELNLPLNMEKPHYRSQRAGEWGLIWAHDSRPIYRALTYIAVPLLGPHQPRYIGLTLYQECQGISNHWQLVCFFNSLFRLTTKKTDGNSPVTSVPLAKANNREIIFMPWCHHVISLSCGYCLLRVNESLVSFTVISGAAILSGQ